MDRRHRRDAVLAGKDSCMPLPLRDLSSAQTRSVESWRDWIGQAYFELEVQTPDSEAFEGEMQCWEAGAFGLSVVRSSSVLYRRRRESCRSGGGRILVTVPLEGEVEFSQFRRQAKCASGTFVLEASDEPYEFAHAPSSRLLVFRAEESALRDRVHDVRRFFATGISARDGLGRLFADFLHLSLPHVVRDPARLLPLLGPQLLDLLGAALESEPGAIGSSLSAVKAAHLARVDAYIRQHLRDPELSLEQIAVGCGVSLRYLHRLFHDAGSTGRQWIRDRRLRVAHDLLIQPDRNVSIAALAYRVGFSDHAQFSRAFRAKFGCSPREARARHRPG
jgi:AraC-like DNA-binding protein